MAQRFHLAKDGAVGCEQRTRGELAPLELSKRARWRRREAAQDTGQAAVEDGRLRHVTSEAA